MAKNRQMAVISLGGSIVVPGEIQIKFLKNFRNFILKFLKKGYDFVIVTGGGITARKYIKAASEVTMVSDEDKDWLGIHATRINAHLLRTIFKKEAYPVILDSPMKKINGIKSRLFIASGWRPGWSSDYVAVLLAERFGAKKIINASNIDYVYDKNKRNIKKIGWREYRKLISAKWKPGMNVPFDPIAAKAAQKFKMEVMVVRGADLKNLNNVLTNKNFRGTIIS